MQKAIKLSPAKFTIRQALDHQRSSRKENQNEKPHKILYLLLASVLTLSLAACAGKRLQATSPSSSSSALSGLPSVKIIYERPPLFKLFIGKRELFRHEIHAACPYVDVRET